MKKINPKPALPPANDPNRWRFWDEQDLTQEARRVFEVCHGCRMCVGFCGSFPDMFNRVDRDIEKSGAEGAELLNDADFKSITDLCWQCKLCYIECPYTPDQKHEWALDVPRLLMRTKAQHARRHGVTLQDKVLGEPGKLGAMTSGLMAPIANFVNENRLVRKVNEKVLGISSEFPVPTFATRRASGVPSRSGYSFLIVYEHVGWITTTRRPFSICSRSDATLNLAFACAAAMSPPSRFGMPQHCCSGRTTS